MDGRAGPGANARTKTALVVEGVPEWRDATRDLLERHGFLVFVTGDAESALTLSRAFQDSIDLLLTDVVMPGLQGTELADAVRLDHPGVVVIYKTAYARGTLAELGLRPTVLLEKPIDESQLLDALARYLPDEADGDSQHAC